MTVLGSSTAVKLSHNYRDASLNLNSKAFDFRHPLVGTWELAPAKPELPESDEYDYPDQLNKRPEESVIGEDGRKLVQDADIKAGGKYRSVVKLVAKYEFSKPNQSMIGTGWLIRPDLLVTAGHVSYDHGNNIRAALGRAVEVRAYIGYSGRGSIKNPDVQFRYGKKIVAPAGWLRNKGVKNQDVSFIQLDKPFTGITPFQYLETPATGDVSIGVVGYPGDLTDGQEKGARMYEMFLKTKWDLGTSKDTMLQYEVDTFGGNSGSPVIVQGKNTSIGVHVYGTSPAAPYNSASVIGKFGHPYDDYLKAFGASIPPGGALHIAPLQGIAAPAPQSGVRGTPGARPRTAVPNGRRAAIQPRRATEGDLADEEGFFDVLKSVVKTGAPILGGVLKTALPFALGPLGGPVGGIAGFALNAAAKLAESAEDDGTQPGQDPNDLTQGLLQQAVIAEAAFQALQLKLDDPNCTLTKDEEDKIYSDMQKHVAATLPAVKQVASTVMPTVVEPALRIAVNSLQKPGGAESGDFIEEIPHLAPYPANIDHPVDRRTEGIIDSILDILGGHSEGGFADTDEEGFLGDFFKSGLRLAGKGLGAAAKAGLPILAQAIQTAVAPGGESGDVDTLATPSTSALSSDALAKRAVVSNAALQAIMNMPPDRLQEEGFFDTFIPIIKKIAPIALKAAPIVLDGLSPTIGGIFRKVTGTESSLAGGFHHRPLRHQKTAILARGQRGAGFLDKAGQWSAERNGGGFGQTGFQPVSGGFTDNTVY